MGLLRLLLALAVVADHAGPAFGWTALRMTGGPLAVQMFYVVSGFYMALVLNEKYLGSGAWWAFAKSRAVRLFPMYWAGLLLTLLVGFALLLGGWSFEPLARWFGPDTTPDLPSAAALALVQVTLIGQDAAVFTAVEPGSGALFATPRPFEHDGAAYRYMLVPQAWTVGLELMFYALAPLLVRRRGAVVTCLLASLALRVVLVERAALDFDPWTYRFFPTELALFLAGALAYHGYRALRGRRLLPAAIAWPALIGVLACVLGYRALPWPLRGAVYGLSPLVVLLPLALPFVFHLTARWRLDRAIGELSYPVYLVHMLFCFAMAALGWPMWTATSGAVVPLASLAAAWALWRFVGARVEVSRQQISARLQAQQAAAR